MQVHMNVFAMISGYVAVMAYVSYFINVHVDILAGACLLIAVAAFLTKLHNGLKKSMSLYRSIFGINNIAIMMTIDFLVHYMPVILLGLPRDPSSYIIAYVLLLAYYIPMRGNLNTVYFGLVSPQWADPYVAGAGLLVLVPAIVRRYR